MLRGPWPRGRLAAKVLVRCPDTVLGTHKVRGPAAGDEVGVPAQQGLQRDEPQLAQRGRKQSSECAEERAVDPGHFRVWVVSA
jgi:hypothetical protein